MGYFGAVFLSTFASGWVGVVNDLIESRTAVGSNLLKMKTGRKGFIGEPHPRGLSDSAI